VIAACKVAGFDLVIVETSGIGQGDAAIVPLADASLYVMTPNTARRASLEKIDMLDFADFVASTSSTARVGQDALRDGEEAIPAQPQALRPLRQRTCRYTAPSLRASTTTALPRSTRVSLPRSSSTV